MAKLDLKTRIQKAEGCEAAEYLHARHSYLHAVAHGKEEWGEFWSRDDETSWGHSFGRFRGFDSIWYNSVVIYNETGYQGYCQRCEQYPELAWYDPRGLRECAVHTLGTDIVVAADDGKSVRASFLTPGVLFNSFGMGDGFFGLTLWERYGADFVYEDGEWKFFVEQVCPDMGGPSDMCNPGRDNWNKMKQGQAGGAGGSKGNTWINEKFTVHANYSPCMPVQNTVPWPVPYATYDMASFPEGAYAPPRNKATEQPKPEATSNNPGGAPGGGGPGGGGGAPGGGPGGGGRPPQGMGGAPGAGGPPQGMGGAPGAGGPPQGQGGAPGAGGPPQGMGGAPGAGGPPQGQGGAPQAAKAAQGFTLQRRSDMTAISPHGNSQLFRYTGLLDGVNVIVSHQAPGTTQSGSTPAAHICMVLSGKLKVTVGGKTYEVGPGDAMRFEAGEERTMENPSEEEACLLLVDAGMGGGQGGAPGAGGPPQGMGGAPGAGGPPQGMGGGPGAGGPPQGMGGGPGAGGPPQGGPGPR